MTKIVKITNVDPSKYKNHVPVYVAPTLNELQSLLTVGKRQFKTELRKTGREKDPPIHVAIYEVDAQGNAIVDSSGRPTPPPMELTEETQIPILPGDQYDLDKPMDALVMDMLKDSEFFVSSTSQYNPASLQRVTIDDPEKSARETNSKATKVLRVLSILQNQTPVGKQDLAFLLKQPVMRMSAEQVDAYLNKVALDTPELLDSLIRKSDFPIRVLLRRCVDTGLIEQRGASFYNGDTCIGLDEDQAVVWLKQPVNDSIVSSLIGQLRSKNAYSEGVLITGNREERPSKGRENKPEKESA